MFVPEKPGSLTHVCRLCDGQVQVPSLQLATTRQRHLKSPHGIDVSMMRKNADAEILAEEQQAAREKRAAEEAAAAAAAVAAGKPVPKPKIQSTFLVKPNGKISRDDLQTLVDVACDYGWPVCMFDDERVHTLLNTGSVDSQTVRAAIVQRWASMESASVAACVGKVCTVCADLGTTNHLHTLAITVVSRDSNSTNVFSMGCAVMESTTADKLLPVLDKVIKRLRTAGARVGIIVTDNGRNMVRAAKDTYNILDIRCFVHSGQLYIRASVMTLPQVVKAENILKNFSKKCYLPCQTRWWSLLDCLERFAKMLRNTNGDGETIGAVDAAIKILAHYRVLGRLMECDNCSILSGMELFYQMSKLVGHDDDKFRGRVAEMSTEVIVAAAAMHPENPWVEEQHFNILPNIIKNVAMVVLDKNDKNLNELLSKQLDDELLKLCSKRVVVIDGKPFWRSIATAASLKNLSALWEVFELSCCSEASTERYFSRQALAHTRLRASMKPDLVFAIAGIKNRDKRPRTEIEKEVRAEAEGAPEDDGYEIVEAKDVDADGSAVLPVPEPLSAPSTAPPLGAPAAAQAPPLDNLITGDITELSWAAAEFYINIYCEQQKK